MTRTIRQEAPQVFDESHHGQEALPGLLLNTGLVLVGLDIDPPDRGYR
ncbi:MAG: hypothetical protein O7E52_26895 [Candidatus Poribacteria bacterium]|nr:hypothetical protein [Candidatus Poribacteria bacterium]